MKSTLKILSLVLVLCLCVSVFSACNDSTSSSEVTSESTSTSTPTEETTDVVDYANVDYSKYLTEDGFVIDVVASDYVTVPDITSISFSQEVMTANEELVNSQIDSLVNSYTITNEIKDRAVEDGDKVNISYVGSVDGVEFEGGATGEEGTVVTAGSLDYIDDFLVQIIGVMPGETIDVEATFPDEYPNNPDLAGKDAVFVTTVNYIEEYEVPEFTDEFVKEELSESYTWETKQDVIDAIEYSIVDNQQYQAVYEWLLENLEYEELPQGVIDVTNASFLQYQSLTAGQYGMDLATMLAYQGYADVDAYLEDNKDDLQEQAGLTLLVQAIAEKEEMTITDEELLVLTGVEDLSVITDQYGDAYVSMLKMNGLIQKVMGTLVVNGADAAK